MQTDATLLDVTSCVRLHTLLHVVGCCCAKFETGQTFQPITLPFKRLMGMCRSMGSHFHDLIDINGAALSIELLEWGRTFSDFWDGKGFHIYG